MKSGAVFLSTPDLDKLVDENINQGLNNRVCSNEGEIQVDHVKKVKKFQEHKMTIFLGVLNGVGVGNSIGSGRFGCVLLATEMSTFKKMAVKEYHDTFHHRVCEGMAEDSPIHRLFFLKHPALVEITTLSMARNIVFSVMELGQKNVYDQVTEHGKYSEENAKAIMRQIIGAVEFLHDQNLVHGSIHPKNLIIFDEEVVKLSDVATGQLLKWIPYSRTPLSVLPYVAPEMKENGLIDACRSSDMWSLGACIFFLVAGASPFNGTTRDVIERSVQTGNFRVPIMAGHDCHRVLHGLLKINPSKRITINQLTTHNWIEKKPSSPKKVVEIATKAPVEVFDEGYMSNASDPPKNKKKHETKKSIWRQYNNTVTDQPGLLVYVMDNNRDDCDKNEVKVETCKLITGALKRPCLRIAIPVQLETSENKVTPLQEMAYGWAANGNQDVAAAVIDSDYGDYSLMDFTGERVRLCQELRTGSKFSSSKQAVRYYNRQNADRLWNYLKLTRCDTCMGGDRELKEHVEENCIYKYWSEAKPSNQDILWSQEDEYNVRVFAIPFTKFKPHASRFTRFRKESAKLFSSGIRRIAMKFRRQSQVSSVSK